MPDNINLINSRTGLSLGNKIQVASSFRQRLVGLLGRSKLMDGEGLLIEHCNQVHMYFMRFEIGVLFLTPDFTIVGLEPCLKRWTLSPSVAEAALVLELPLGVIETTECRIGDVLYSAQL